MKSLKKIFYLFFPLLIGGLSSLFSGDFSNTYNTLTKPLFSPPSWVFGVVWTLLFLLMGISYYLIKKNYSYSDYNASFWYYLQLFLNFTWSIIFFRFKLFTFSFIWLIVLLFTIVITYIKFKKINKISAYLLIPYIVWVIFAGYLNLMISILN